MAIFANCQSLPTSLVSNHCPDHLATDTLNSGVKTNIVHRLNQPSTFTQLFNLSCRVRFQVVRGVCCRRSLGGQSPQRRPPAANTKKNLNLLPENSSQSTNRPPRARNAKRSAKPSLVTFFGFGKKVTRLSAETDGLIFAFIRNHHRRPHHTQTTPSYPHCHQDRKAARG